MSDHNLFNYFFANCEDYDDITTEPLHDGNGNVEEPDHFEYTQNLNLNGLLDFDASFDDRAESDGQKMEKISACDIGLQAVETKQDSKSPNFRLSHKDDKRDKVGQEKMKKRAADFEEDDDDNYDQDDIRSSEAYTNNGSYNNNFSYRNWDKRNVNVVPLDPSGISLFDSNDFPKDVVGNNKSQKPHQLRTISPTQTSTHKLERSKKRLERMRFPIPREKPVCQKRRKPNNLVNYQSIPQLYHVPGFSKPIINRQSLHRGRITSIEECEESINALNGGTLDVVEDQRTKRKIVDFLQLYGYSFFSLNENKKTDDNVVRNDVKTVSNNGFEEEINWSELFPFEEADEERYGEGNRRISREDENLHQMDASATILNAGNLKKNHSGIEKMYLAACNAISNSAILTVSPVVVRNLFNHLAQSSPVNKVNTEFPGLERWNLTDAERIGLPSADEYEIDPIVYVTMGQLAIRNSPYKFLTEDQIASFILHHWPHFRFANYGSWKQSLTLALRRKFFHKMSRGEMGLPRHLFYQTVGLCAPEFSGPENSSIFYHFLSLGLIPRKLCKLFRPHFECQNNNEPKFVEANKELVPDDLSKPEFLEGFGVNMVNGRPGRFEQGMADRFHMNIDWYFNVQKQYAKLGSPNWTTPPLNSSSLL
ncbi:hypothetical protein GCK72_023059 [Caenorhabditis remanei]|uniref:Fork-head domain-containing protein n=1 Tax=Caenorhabditis remanei TaxID=31234 RepID=A0A6A5FVN7_CAERE|nr:hypothetical protein GCK72_023059 [Caenorhabditis remanei]KAF1746602.1 hypothetical protein GCK72_023059 [Caenorhabditis remanei]